MGAGDQRRADTKTVSAIDVAINDEMCWASLLTLEAVLGIVRGIIEWGEGCPCHSHMDWEGIPAEVATRWAACKHRGRRLAELASGDVSACLTPSLPLLLHG